MKATTDHAAKVSYSKLFHIYQLQHCEAVLVKCVCTINLSIEVAVKCLYIYLLQHHEVVVKCLYIYQLQHREIAVNCASPINFHIPSRNRVAYNHQKVQ